MACLTAKTDEALNRPSLALRTLTFETPLTWLAAKLATVAPDNSPYES